MNRREMLQVVVCVDRGGNTHLIDILDSENLNYIKLYALLNLDLSDVLYVGVEKEDILPGLYKAFMFVALEKEELDCGDVVHYHQLYLDIYEEIYSIRENMEKE